MLEIKSPYCGKIVRLYCELGGMKEKVYKGKNGKSHLDGVKIVFDGGAGCGRFSILLAKIIFVNGALEDLKDFNDKF